MITITGDQTDSERIKKLMKHPAYRKDDNSSPIHRQLIGYIGLFLPVILIFMAVLRDGLIQWKSLKSVSAYYYSGAAAAFVGMLVSLALFLFTYRGYDNECNWVDRAASITAGVAALGVAVFPTKAPDGWTPLSWWTPLSGILHFGFAILLFLMFAVFALFLFPIKAKGEKVRSGKRRRNRVYVSCGVIILASLIWAVMALRSGKSIFLPESVALIAFAVSWLAKGQAHKSIANKVLLLFRRKEK